MSHKDLDFANSLRSDLPASVVVFLVALPLCLGIALASGTPLISGMIAGIIGGIVVGLLSESALGVSGPTASLAIVILTAVNELGSLPALFTAVMLSGLFQLILGFLKAGFIGYFLPSSVIKGILTGLGSIIFLKQIPHAVGYDKVYEGSLSFFQDDGQTTLSELINMLDFISPGPLAIAAISLTILILWERPWIKRFRWSKLIPGPLLAVISGTFLGIIFQKTSLFQLKADQIVTMPMIADYSTFSELTTFPDFSAFFRFDVISVALTIAIISSIETLLSSEAVDKLDPYKRVTSTNRELFAQGIGNCLSGLLGGLPIAQVIVRSSSNVQAEAKTKISTIAHGAWLLVSLLFFPTILNLIPLSSLAAILLLVGYKLIEPKRFFDLYKEGFEQFLPFIVTVIALIFSDLLIGTALGLAVSLLSILWENYRHPYYADIEHPENGICIQLSEDVSFLNKVGLLQTLDHIPNGLRVVIDASKTRKMHPDIHEIIDSFLINAKTRDIEVEYIKMNQPHIIDHQKQILNISQKKSKKFFKREKK